MKPPKPAKLTVFSAQPADLDPLHRFFLGQLRRYAARGVRPPQFFAMGVPDPSGEAGKYESLGLLLSHGPSSCRQNLYFEVNAFSIGKVADTCDQDGKLVVTGRKIEWSIYAPTVPPEGLILVGWLTARMDGGPCCLRGPDFSDGLPDESIPALVAWSARGDAVEVVEP